MSASGKMSLVVLRSWSDGAPKVRAIAPPDDDRAVYVPDHQGRFVTEEIKERYPGEAPRCASSASQYEEFRKDLKVKQFNRKTEDDVVYRKHRLQRCHTDANRHSYSGTGGNCAELMENFSKASSMYLSLHEVNAFGEEGFHRRHNLAMSPDNSDAYSLEYTPPASPVSGRYRNLGPELAATIPKRTVRNSWIAEVKSRWNKSGSVTSTTHPSSCASSRKSSCGSKRANGGTLKSYSSSPSLTYHNNNDKFKRGGKQRTRGLSEEEEDDDYDDDDVSYRIPRDGEIPHHHRRSSLQRIRLDEEETVDEEQPFFNPLYKFGQSGCNPMNNSRIKGGGENNNNCHRNNGNLPLLQNHMKADERSPPHPSASLLHRRSVSGIALRVDDDSQSDRSRSSLGYTLSGNPSSSPSPPLTTTSPNDHIYSSLTDIRDLNNWRLDPSRPCGNCGSSSVVLVEVIRKEGKPSEKKAEAREFGDKRKLEKLGSVELIQNLGKSLNNGVASRGKRHSVTELESLEVVSNNKFTNANVEGSPGKVARLKESLKRFGRFGRSNTEKIIKTQSESGVSANEIKGECKTLSGETDGEHLGENTYKNPSEIIVTSLIDAEKDSSITVKPVPRQRSKPLAESPIYAVPNHNKAARRRSQEIESGPEEKVRKNEDLTKQDQSDKTESISVIEDGNDKCNGISSTSENADEAHLPHLELDKGDDDHSTSLSLDESSRAESMSYSTTSHELDRSMPQQIVQNHQHLVPKVDIVKTNSICSNSSGSSVTLNCEVTPVIRKRSLNKKINQSPQEIKVVRDPAAAVMNKKQSVRKTISSSSSESKNNLDANNIIVSKETVYKSEDKEQQSISCVSPVTPNEPAGVCNNDNIMYSLSLTQSGNSSSCKIFDDDPSDNAHLNVSNSSSSNGDESPEMTAKRMQRSSEFNEFVNMENGTASAYVPVQAVNRHVVGYGISHPNISNSITNNLNDEKYNESIASKTISKNESEWNRSSLRDSLKDFCEDMLQDKTSTTVPDIVDAVINFYEDSSSIEHDERENSIEYISIANVKVNQEQIHPRDELPSSVIALDLGSRRSGYAYWIREESEFVRIGNVDGGSSCPATHKAPSWIMFDDLYLDGEEDGESADSIRPGFGFQALDKYLTDDAHGQIMWRWRENLHDAKLFPYIIDSKTSDEDLIFMMKSAIRHYGRQALEQITQSKKGAPLGPTVLLVAIPSTFDQRARQLVREAALEAGVLKESDSVALIEDSCATGLYSLHVLKSKLTNGTNTKVSETSFLSVDIGASYLHVSGFKVTEGIMRQLLISRSDPLIDSPESLFEAELSTVFTPTYIFDYQHKYNAGWLKLMTEFEHAKNRYDPLSKQNYYVFVPSSFVDHFRRFTSMEVEDALEASDMVWNKTGALGIPHWKLHRFLQPLLDYVNDKVIATMKKHKFEHLIVTGGRAGAILYVDAIRTAIRGFGATLHVPKEYNAAVLQGSVISLTNLAPRLIIRSRFSIGVGVMTPFSEDIHPEEKRVMRDGKSWCADVWDALIKADQELELNRVIIKRSYVGAQPGQSLLVLPLFKSTDEPKFVTESSVQKCCELKFTSAQKAWQEVELVLVCRPCELIIKAMDRGVMKSYVVVDFSN